MKKNNLLLAIRFLAVVVFAACLAVWIAGGAERGWTKTSVPVTFEDEITGLEGIRYEEKFVPGVEFPAAGTVLGAFLWIVGGFFRQRES
ncbi:MAG: hypothetical protein SNJ52_03320 [Verrucomicrobiia bacterium]